MILRAALLVAAMGATALPAAAQTVAEQAAAARTDLILAIETLEKTTSGRDQVAALSQTITAYERGLGALREALRQATIREAALLMRFEAKRDRVARLVGVMSAMGTDPSPLLLLHPSGPLGTARSGMMLADVTPALQAEVDQLRAELQEVAELRRQQSGAADTLQRGLTAAQAARTALSQAIASRGPLPRRFTDDPERLTLMIEDADTLDALATGLAPDLNADSTGLADFASAMGRIAMPVVGQILRRFGEADAAGIERPGLVIATRPQALITAPWSGTIRYRGAFLDYGNVMILEPGPGYLLVLAGLGTLYGEVGEVVGAGAPLGLMGGTDSTADPVQETRNASGSSGTETLYMELRQGGQPVDPGDWFAEAKE
ncbi:Septal ring factor EnvC, activator of murein hydrolases AmiA and AmiB [Gemmobacter megaterium]|uniref:Septal ring factor EnvC, activator of murein hydrolases AmiA and AmiB n=1 Tax=Gemmobacter megaterium TaxID=1086013 RepID=A0A1N7M957_9RHOB|nr:peptidoglycan DD-metalloendopeptidase family protein [Gemmobacter megaterium]GGE08156.1 peptidase M23 [Gemmobacter megaterium]SIS82582.1 Septal ring factor EnvC, activator of murein hydrolases AmiA and AmiB [Gemmobacter megaterium]